MIFVKFKIEFDGCELYDYSWFDMGTQHDYELGVIKDKVLIREVYAEGIEEEIFENYFDEDTNIYEDDNCDFISVYKVQDMTEKELDVLVKMGVLYR